MMPPMIAPPMFEPTLPPLPQPGGGPELRNGSFQRL